MCHFHLSTLYLSAVHGSPAVRLADTRPLCFQAFISSVITHAISHLRSHGERGGKSEGGTLLWQGTAINKRKGEGAALWISGRLSVPTTTRLRQHDRCKFHQLMAGLATSGSLHMHSLWELIPFEMQGQRQD